MVRRQLKKDFLFTINSVINVCVYRDVIVHEDYTKKYKMLKIFTETLSQFYIGKGEGVGSNRKHPLRCTVPGLYRCKVLISGKYSVIDLTSLEPGDSHKM